MEDYYEKHLEEEYPIPTKRGTVFTIPKIIGIAILIIVGSSIGRIVDLILSPLTKEEE